MRHLVCYVRVDKPEVVVRQLIARNQFGKITLATRVRQELCVPTNKLPF